MKRSQIYLMILGLWLCLGANSLAQAPPNFRIEFITYPSENAEERINGVRDANNLGVVVGWIWSTVNEVNRSFVVDQNGFITPPIGPKKKLYLLEELVDITGLSAGYKFPTIEKINESCQVVGFIKGDGLPGLAFFADLNDPLSFEVLPDPASAGSVRGLEINDWGDVLIRSNSSAPYNFYIYNPMDPETAPLLLTDPGTNQPLEARVFGLNNYRQLVGRLASNDLYFRLTPETSEDPAMLETIDPSLDTYYINDSGQFCGTQTFLIGTKKKRNNQYSQVAYRYTGQTIEPIAGDLQSHAEGINSSGDVVGRLTADGRDPLFIYRDGHGLLDLDDLVVGEAADLSFWSAASLGYLEINDRDTETGFGQVFGIAQISTTTGQVTTWEKRLFILTPIAPAAPEPGITVTPTDGLFTTETGDTAEFTVVLDTAPAPMKSVTIDISTSDTTEGLIDDPDFGLVEFSSLTFTSDNWDTPQTVIVIGVDDSNIDGSVLYTIETAPAISDDLDYDELDPEDVEVTNLDDEQAPMVTYDSEDTPTDIPDRGMTESTITITDDFTIVNMVVTLNITHQRPSDLDVFLVGPNDEVQLYNFDGPNDVSNFNGMSTDDLWTLKVYDTRKKKDGDLNGWSITVEIN